MHERYEETSGLTAGVRDPLCPALVLPKFAAQ